MGQHTPGPWQYAFEGGTTAFITESDGSTIICIRTTENSTSHRNLAANARLIAAAPDLLETLQAVEPILCRMYGQQAADLPPVKIVRAAIAKATGARHD